MTVTVFVEVTVEQAFCTDKVIVYVPWSLKIKEGCCECRSKPGAKAQVPADGVQVPAPLKATLQVYTRSPQTSCVVRLFVALTLRGLQPISLLMEKLETGAGSIQMVLVATDAAGH